ncbi:MAG TPA: TaqI-like C-terminal specificity domain-containing protein [Ktedonobacteraceae bacterium]|nr:TaqI-like C-terminal specificity domain-containing protein [Ktedonobacteraceae bacterium]
MQNSEGISETPTNNGRTIPIRSRIFQGLWDELATFPKLADVAEIQRGIEYPFIRNNEEIFSEEPDDDFALGLSRAGSEIEPYIARPSRYLNRSPKSLQGKFWQERWGKPKVIANAVSTDVERWPIVGAIDEQGLVYTQDFYGIWPTGSLPIEVLATLINSPIVNAFLSTHSLSEQDLRAVLEQAPIPNFTKADIHLITSLVRNYRATRERWLKEPGGMTGQGILGQLDGEILGIYRLTMQAERDLIAYFEGYKRLGPIPLTQVKPSHENRLWKTMLRVEDVQNEGDDIIVGVFVYSWEGGYPDKIVHFPLSIVPQDLRERIAPDVTLRAKVNVGTAYEKDLIFEDIEIMPGVSEEFRARFA